MFHVKHIAVRYYNYTFFNSRFSSSMTVSPSLISPSYSSLSLCRRLISCPSSFSRRTTDISSAPGCRSSQPKSISSSILSTLHFTIKVPPSCPLQQNIFSKTFICIQTSFHQADKTSSYAFNVLSLNRTNRTTSNWPGFASQNSFTVFTAIRAAFSKG